MQLGLVGIGRMGGSMRERLRGTGHEVIGYDHDPDVSDVGGLAGLVDRLARPRVVWLMVPTDVTDRVVDELAPLLAADDLILDGGNTHYVEDGPRASRLAAQGIGYVDVGVSGGVWGREEGYALMVGGAAEHVQRCMPVFDALTPPGELGFAHAGPVGAGHYAKMVHNGVEYALMQAYAEGYELLAGAELVDDVSAVVRSWRAGSVVRSWLLDLLDRALVEDPHLTGVRGFVEDTGEGRWTVAEATRLGVPVNAISAALFARFASRQEDSPAMRAVAALRREFGGHPVRQ